MNSFLLAIQFLTVAPLKIKEYSERTMAGATIYFPLVGLLLGLMLFGINALLGFFNFYPFAANVILVIALIVMTGGIHLDGLSDTADAFLSGKPKEEMLAIMRDPHIGAMGVLSIISIILLKIGLLSSVEPSSKAAALFLMGAVSRWSAVFSIFLFPYARQDGKAGTFIRGMNLKIFLISLATVIIFAFAIWRLKGLIVLLIVAGFTYLIGKFAGRKIEGITGDTLGATIELAELVTLFAVCIG
ncbi:MAG: adenosylcobinamide-GDP ribazoletransferase [Candidatus Omnitrophica bacterium CG07_land_8_20_14_0_80_42_15]|uniref:Adenosylcobinamide-GDP ribazoletransferase n=1 Tax=Candidatus Aquitaenariimonas noxiae TaxID=1974741 RepID=A0A2J0KSZ3_9BACT|nr:MAG: adenosylcobinamide-GDP ribazoletransferase [Candidatus Omnitrophica bacterium CG07_land_8_20_14_0_80_42_15]